MVSKKVKRYRGGARDPAERCRGSTRAQLWSRDEERGRVIGVDIGTITSSMAYTYSQVRTRQLSVATLTYALQRDRR